MLCRTIWYFLMFRRTGSRRCERVHFGRIGSRLGDDKELRGWIFQLLESARLSARQGAALAILSWPGGPSRDHVDLIFKAISDQRDLDSYQGARIAAASSLISRSPFAEEALAVSLEALYYGTHPWEHLEGSKSVRKRAARGLWRVRVCRSTMS